MLSPFSPSAAAAAAEHGGAARPWIQIACRVAAVTAVAATTAQIAPQMAPIFEIGLNKMAE